MMFINISVNFVTSGGHRHTTIFCPLHSVC